MILDFTDELLCNSLNKVISGLLPHKNYEENTFGLLYPALQMVLPLNSATGYYRIILSTLDKYYLLSTSFPEGTYKVRITKDKFEGTLENNIPDFILDPIVDVKTLMDAEGKSSDLSIPSVQQEIMGLVYVKCVEIYQTCFDLEVTYDDAIAALVDLKDSIKNNIIETGMQFQRGILSTGCRIGRKTYIGNAGWMEFTQELLREISELDKIDSHDLVSDGLGIIPDIDKENEELGVPIGYYGIPQLDDRTPMLSHRFAVLVARENTGKTTIMIHEVASLVRRGVKVLFACGESQKSQIWISIVSSYIFQEYGMHFEPRYLTESGMEQLTPDDRQLVASVKARIAVSGLVISDDVSYDNVIAKFEGYYQSGCRAFFIDHSQSLRGRNGRPIGDLVSNLAFDLRDFKRSHPVYIQLASQMSADMKDILQKAKTNEVQVSTTARSSDLSNEADEIFVLFENENLVKQGLLGWMTAKRRQALKPAPFYIKKAFHVCSFIYEDEYQGANAIDNPNDLLSALGYTDDETGFEFDEIEDDI